MSDITVTMPLAAFEAMKNEIADLRRRAAGLERQLSAESKAQLGMVLYRASQFVDHVRRVTSSIANALDEDYPDRKWWGGYSAQCLRDLSRADILPVRLGADSAVH